MKIFELEDPMLLVSFLIFFLPDENEIQKAEGLVDRLELPHSIR